ncbi:MAG: hypothetical protein Q8S21_06785 [Candidatus Paracaedibacteraceae bacterium]|nr:hypothetical protein [Candidatus Paracaedibacteraceae bacterium]
MIAKILLMFAVSFNCFASDSDDGVDECAREYSRSPKSIESNQEFSLKAEFSKDTCSFSYQDAVRDERHRLDVEEYTSYILQINDKLTKRKKDGSMPCTKEVFVLKDQLTYFQTLLDRLNADWFAFKADNKSCRLGDLVIEDIESK